MNYYLFSLLFISSFISCETEAERYKKFATELHHETQTEMETVKQQLYSAQKLYKYIGIGAAVIMGFSLGMLMDEICIKNTSCTITGTAIPAPGYGVNLNLSTQYFPVVHQTRLVFPTCFFLCLSSYVAYICENRYKCLHKEYLTQIRHLHTQLTTKLSLPILKHSINNPEKTLVTTENSK